MNPHWRSEPWSDVRYPLHTRSTCMAYRHDGEVIGCANQEDLELITRAIDQTRPPSMAGVKTFTVTTSLSVLRGDEQRIEDALPALSDELCRLLPGAVRVTMSLSERGRQQRLFPSPQPDRRAPLPAGGEVSPTPTQESTGSRDQHLTPHMVEIIQAIKGGSRTVKEIQAMCTFSEKFVRANLEDLVSRRVLAFSRGNRGNVYKVLEES